MHYDLIILGAGAAGMMAAVAAGEATLGASAKRQAGDDRSPNACPAGAPCPAEHGTQGREIENSPSAPPLDPSTPRPLCPLRIAVFEKNAQPGIKVLVCGGGRCNITNAGSVEFLIAQFGRNGRFLTPALGHMDNDGLRSWFAGQGVPTHEEHDGKIYPDSNQARSVVEALLRRMRQVGVEIHAGPGSAARSLTVTPPSTTPVPPPVSPALDVGRSPIPPNGSMARSPDGQSASHSTTQQFSNSTIPPPPTQHSSPRFTLTTADGRTFTAHRVILAVGGQSYTRMGTTGDGYTLAAALGHTIVKPRPAIVGLLCQEEWPKTLSGLAVKDVEVRIEAPGPLPRLATGKPTPSINDILLTHFGLSGPAILNPSEIVAELLEKFPTVTVRVDFLRQRSGAELAALLRQWQQRQGTKRVRLMLGGLFPQRLADMFCQLAGIPPEQTCATLTAGQIHQLIERLKVSRFTIHDTRGFKEAMVTAGGVALPEVNPRTLESKKIPGLYLAGEVLDLTGPSGGYNLQLAFSTGHLAGTAAAQSMYFPSPLSTRNPV